jgi:hypothetical protein
MLFDYYHVGRQSDGLKRQGFLNDIKYRKWHVSKYRNQKAGKPTKGMGQLTFMYSCVGQNKAAGSRRKFKRKKELKSIILWVLLGDDKTIIPNIRTGR